MGNELRGDDAAGVLVAQKLLRKKDKLHNVLILEGAHSPENFTGVIRRYQPHLLLIVDAGDFGAVPGEVSLLEPEDTLGGMGTHGISMGDFVRYLQQETECDAGILAIQVAGNEFGDPVCPHVMRAVQQVSNEIYKILSSASLIS